MQRGEKGIQLEGGKGWHGKSVAPHLQHFSSFEEFPIHDEGNDRNRVY